MTPKELGKKIFKIKLMHPFHKVVVINGCFDLLHAGHMSMMENAKGFTNGPSILVVGVNSDDSIKKLKGPNRPILPEAARLFAVQKVKPVDFAFIFDSTDFGPYLEECGQCVFIKGEDYKEITDQEVEVLERTESHWSTVGSGFDITTTEICKKIRSS